MQIESTFSVECQLSTRIVTIERIVIKSMTIEAIFIKLVKYFLKCNIIFLSILSMITNLLIGNTESLLELW